jgi:probable phosphoglycerate mutase
VPALSRSTSPHEIVLVRHGETEWSRARRHTGLTEVKLSNQGRCEAVALGARLSVRRFALVLTSPAARAVETCRLAGFGAEARVRDGLHEWDYGEYEGLTTVEIRRERPGWTIWTGEVPGGETIAEVAARADAVLDEIRGVDGETCVFSHGHFLRVLAARWLGLDPAAGALLSLDPATVSVLGHEHDRAVIREWNAVCEPGQEGVSRTS